MAKTSKATIVSSVRTNHRTLATLYKFYSSKGIHVDSVSSLCKIALDDLAEILIRNNLSKRFEEISEAMMFISPLKQQSAHAHKLRQTLISEITMEPSSVTPTGTDKIEDADMEDLVHRALEDEGE